MRHLDMTAGLIDLLFKNHFELLDRTRNRPLGFPSLPFAIELALGELPAQTCTMQLQARDGHLLVSIREDDRTMVFKAPLAGLQAPAGQQDVTVTLGDRTGSRTHAVAASAIGKFSVPQAFKGMQAKLAKHLQTLFPALSEAGQAKAAADEAIGAASANSAQASARIEQALQGQGLERLDGQTQAAPATDAASKAVSPAAASPAPAPSEYATYVLGRHNQADLRFEGKLIAGVQSALFRGRSYIFSVYQTKGGKFVGVKRGVSMLLGERDTLEAKVAERSEDLVPFFGYSPLAKALYEQLQLQTDEVIE